MEYTLSIKDLYKCQEGCVHYAMSLEAEANKIRARQKRDGDFGRLVDPGGGQKIKLGRSTSFIKKIKKEQDTKIQSLTDSANQYQKAAIIAGTFFKNMDNYDNID